MLPAESPTTTSQPVDPTGSADPTDPAALVEKIMTEGPIGIAHAARLMGTFRDGKATHSTTITRWASKGVRLADGRLLRLEVVRVNGRLVTSRAALVRFVAAQQDPPNAPPPTITTPTRAPARKRAAERASAELDRLGM